MGGAREFTLFGSAGYSPRRWQLHRRGPANKTKHESSSYAGARAWPLPGNAVRAATGFQLTVLALHPASDAAHLGSLLLCFVHPCPQFSNVLLLDCDLFIVNPR